MGTTRRSAYVAVSLLAASILGCGGGGGGGGSGSASTSSPPPFTISNLTYTPQAAYVNSGGGQVTISGSIQYANASDGVAAVTLDVADSSGAIISSKRTAIAGGTEVTAGTLNATVTAGTTVVGAYTIRVTATDVAGSDSNTLTGGFKISNSAWVAKTPMPNPRSQFAAAASGGLAYVIGGELLGTGTTPGPDSALVDVYDPTMDSWSAGVPLPTARKAAVAATVNGVIYVIGGYDLGSPGGLSTVEAFDPTAGTWTAMAPMPTPRRNASAAVLDGKVCIFGGESSASTLSTTECLDPIANSWAVESPMPTARYALGSDTMGAYAYAVGGYAPAATPPYLATVERFDIVGNSWSSVAPMTTTRENAGVVAASGSLFAFGGSNSSRPLNTVEAYDPTAGTWSAKTAMPMGFTGVGAVAINDVVYVFDSYHTLQYTPANDILQ